MSDSDKQIDSEGVSCSGSCAQAKEYVHVIMKHSRHDGTRPQILGVYERLSDAEDDHVPDRAEVVRAHDEVMVYETREDRWAINNLPVIPNRYSS